jgi:hypothetical protein
MLLKNISTIAVQPLEVIPTPFKWSSSKHVYVLDTQVASSRMLLSLNVLYERSNTFNFIPRFAWSAWMMVVAAFDCNLALLKRKPV